MFTTSPVWEMAGPEPVHPLARALVQGLRVLGYVEGQNLILERRSAEGRFERFGEIVAELVRFKVDVIVTSGPGVAAAKAVTTTVPIVMAAGGDSRARRLRVRRDVPALDHAGDRRTRSRRSCLLVTDKSSLDMALAGNR
jgi:hypothetical protein